MNAHRLPKPPIDKNPAETETAIFSMGCFWGPDAQFGVVDGVISIRVGYTGGTTPSPTYHHLGDHIESIQIDFDPTIISLNNLLEMFWANHNPQIKALKRQYASALYYHDDPQQKLIEKSVATKRSNSVDEIFTEVMAAKTFVLAEDYHQKYRLQQNRALFAEFRAIYPDMQELINSTAAARVNGLLGGYGGKTVFEKIQADLGLSPAALELIREAI